MKCRPTNTPTIVALLACTTLLLCQTSTVVCGSKVPPLKKGVRGISSPKQNSEKVKIPPAPFFKGESLSRQNPFHKALGALPRFGFAYQSIRGITLAPIEDTRLGDVGYGSVRCKEALAEIAHLGATWVSLTPFGRMDDLNSTDILDDFEIPVERNEDMLRRTVADAHALGLKVAIIPHVYVMSGRWRGRIDPGSDELFEQWFTSYDRFVSRFAALAEEVDADLFSIGVEFKSSTNTRADRWRETIELVRSIYSGPVTYSANWDEVEYVEFWDALDMIGINAFWPLASKPGEGFDRMCKRAEEVADELEGLAFYWDRPVIFVEFGVKTARDAALAPWEWPEHCESLIYDETYQAEAYQAVLKEMTYRWWFKGLFIWKYISDPYDETQEAPTGFSPRGKLAESVLSMWFKDNWDVTAPHIELE